MIPHSGFFCGALWLCLLVAAPAEEKEVDRTAIAIEALSRMENVDLEQNPAVKVAVLKVLEKTRGRPAFVQIVRQFKLKDQDEGLLEVVVANPASEASVEATRLMLAHEPGQARLQQALKYTNAAPVIDALGNAHDKKGTSLLTAFVGNPSFAAELRRAAVRSLVQTRAGAEALVNLANSNHLPADVRFSAGAELQTIRWPEIKMAASKLFPPLEGKGNQTLPPVAELLKMKADAANGARIFAHAEVGCISCHRVLGQGAEVGPDLSEIGSKLGRDALIESIVDPNAGISFGYEANQIELKSGDEAYGLVVSDTADEIAIKDAKGIVARYRKKDVARREVLKQSIMPTGLHATMTTQEFADLIEYLASLKKPN